MLTPARRAARIWARMEICLNPEQLSTLAMLAAGIIPPDEKDAGAGGIGAGSRLAERIRNGINTVVYLQGLEIAKAIAMDTHARDVAELSPSEIHELLATVRDKLPGFFKQLRMDVSALYLSDPAVWQRIGFPGPSTASGGYSDFDQPQTQRITNLKEPPADP
jgi:hypothetical protein